MYHAVHFEYEHLRVGYRHAQAALHGPSWCYPAGMAFLPRRRLVLASAHVGSTYTNLSTSQLPWDAEEAASFSTGQEIGAGSQITCQTQESAVHAAHRFDNPVQAYQQAGFPDSRTEEQIPCNIVQAPAASVPRTKDKPNHLGSPSLAGCCLQPQGNALHVAQMSMTVKEYTEVYNFLTKGTGHVQEASSKEGALFKLTYLRQVPACDPTCLACFAARLNTLLVQVMRMHALTQSSRTKQVNDCLRHLQS